MTAKRSDETFSCPNCGADVTRGASFCRACGATDESGWNADDDFAAESMSGGYGDDPDFDYDEFLAREFPGQASRPPAARLRAAEVAVVVVLLCLAMLLFSIL